MGPMSPSQWVLRYLCRKALFVDAQKKSSAAVGQAMQIQKRRTALLRRITKFLEDQDVFMPGLRAYLKSQGLGTSDIDASTKPEALPIYLPSSIPTSSRSSVCITGLQDFEGRLRFAQGVEALSALRRHLRTRVLARKLSGKNAASQRAYVRSRALQDQIEERIQATVTRYNAARAALLALQGSGDWESVLAVLKPEDVRGICERVMTAEEKEDECRTRQMAGVADDNSLTGLPNAPVIAIDPRLALGEGRRTLSWIWYSVSEKELQGSSQEVEASYESLCNKESFFQGAACKKLMGHAFD